MLDDNTVKVTGAVRISVMSAVPLRMVALPVMTRPYVPAVVDRGAVSQSVTVESGRAGLGKKVLSTPMGNPANSIVTGAVNVAEAVSATLQVTAVPGYIVQEGGEGTNPKSGVATVSVTSTVAVRSPPCPVRVMG